MTKLPAFFLLALFWVSALLLVTRVGWRTPFAAFALAWMTLLTWLVVTA